MYIYEHPMCALDSWACLGTSHPQLRRHACVAVPSCAHNSMLDIARKARAAASIPILPRDEAALSPRSTRPNVFVGTARQELASEIWQCVVGFKALLMFQRGSLLLILFCYASTGKGATGRHHGMRNTLKQRRVSAYKSKIKVSSSSQSHRLITA